MDLIITGLIALMPLLGMIPLAVGAVVVVALLVSPRFRDTFAEWTRRRMLGRDASPDAVPSGERTAALQAEVEELRGRLARLERARSEEHVAAPPAGSRNAPS